MAPRDALAVYAVIAYMDTVSGVVFPRGGVRALPDALAAAASDAGVQFRYGTTVTALEKTGGRVGAVLTEQAGRIACDAVVLTTELSQTYALLGSTPRRALRLRHSLSAVVAHVGCPAVASQTAHHTILFGDAWDHTFADIIGAGQLMRDPSLPVTRPTASDPTLAPRGRDLLYVLAPAPNLESGGIDWDSVGRGYVDDLIALVGQRLLPGLPGSATVLDVVTPADWARRGMAVRARAHVRPNRPVPPGQHGARHRQRGAGRILHGARGRGADHPDLRATRRGPHHRRQQANARAHRHESRFAMMRSEWAAAGIEDPLLREGCRRCRELNAAHGRTFFLATRLLAPDQRPPVHALYGFARYADDILDDLDPRVDPAVRARRLQRLSERLFSGGVHADDPLVAAVTHTARRYRISSQLFVDFRSRCRWT